MEELRQKLHRLRLEAGEPSVREITRRVRSFSQTTVHNVLKLARLPRWGQLELVVEALGGDSADYLPLWIAIRDAQGSPEVPEPDCSTNHPTRHLVGVIPPLADCYQERATAAAVEKTLRDRWAPVPCQVISGMGGVGKTQLVAGIADRMWRENLLDLLVWINARSRDSIVAGYAHAEATLSAVETTNAENVGQRFLERLANPAGRWLVVLDDLNHPSDLVGLWPPHTQLGRTVVTTRNRAAALAGAGRDQVDLDLFAPEEVERYLAAKLAGRPKLLEGAAELAAELGYLPLALAQATAYMLDRGLSGAAYRDRFAEDRMALEDLVSRSKVDGYRATVAATWALSIDAANQHDPVGVAGPLLELASPLDSTGVPEEVFTTQAVLEHLGTMRGEPVNAGQAHDGLWCLRRFSLVEIDEDSRSRTVRVHALIQRATRDQLKRRRPDDAGYRAEWITARVVADALVQAWPENERDLQVGQALRDSTEHLVRYHPDALWEGGCHPVLLRMGESLGRVGQAKAAVRYFEHLKTQARQRLGRDHPDTLAARGYLAYWRGETGDPNGAVTAYRCLLDDQLGSLPADHPSVLTTRGHLAYWRGRMGDWAGAAAEFNLILRDQLRVFPASDPRIASTRGNLYRWQGHAGDPAAAAAGFTQLLQQQRDSLGYQHPQTMTTRHNLARWHGRAGKPQLAAALLAELLEQMREVLGSDHPDLLAVRHNLHRWQARAGHCAQAAREFEGLLADRVRVLGKDHPRTLSTRHNLARWRGEAGDPTGAVNAYRSLVEDLLRVLGPEHPDTLAGQANLACWLGETGDPHTATRILERVLADRLRLFGPDHPGTLDVRHNLAYWRGQAEDPQDAAAAFEQLLADQLRLLHPDHPHTLGTRHNLAYWRGRAGDPGRAMRDYQSLLADALRVLGPEHPDTLAFRHNLAYWQGQAGDPAGAAADFTLVLADRLRVLGPEHPDTLTTRHNLARWQGEAGNPTSAVTAFTQLLADRIRVLGNEHPATLATLRALGNWLERVGDRQGALAQFSRLLALQLRVLGNDHADTRSTRSRIALLRDIVP